MLLSGVKANDRKRHATPTASSELTGDAAGPIYGRVENIFEGNIVGWAFERDHKPVFVTCIFDGESVGGTIADSVRSDVSGVASFAPSNCGFALQFDVKAFLTKCENFEEFKTRLRLEVNQKAGLLFVCADPYAKIFRSTADEHVRGHLDGLKKGRLSGWCVEDGEGSASTIHVLIDDILQAAVECSETRPDLHQLLGISHGGFTFDLPRKYHDGKNHVVRCVIPSSRRELLGSPLDFQLKTEAEVVHSEVHAFAGAIERLEVEIAEARFSFEQYIQKKGAFLATYRYLWPIFSLGDATRARLKRLAREGDGEGKMTIVLPTYKSDLALLEAALDSVIAQTDPNWELVISDAGSTDGFLQNFIKARAAADPRIKIVFNPHPLGIAENTNQGLKLASGAIVGFLDHDDTLAPEAVSLMRQAFSTGNYDLVYSDEDKINAAGEHVEPHFKSAMNFDLLLTMNYMCHFVGIRRTVIEELRGLRRDFDGAQDWDLILRVLGKVGPARVGHIPRVIYHWRMTSTSTATSSSVKSYAVAAGIAAVNSYLAANGHDAKANKASRELPYAEVNWRPGKSARLSIIIPTKDKLDLVMHCVASIEGTIGDNIIHEIIIVDNASTSRSLKGFEKIVAANNRVRVVSYGGPFNYSAINNYAVQYANHDNILFLNNDVFFTNNGWASKMLGIVARKKVGAVGLKLLYPDGTVQHCGVVLGNGGIAGHAFSYMDEMEAGYFARALVDQQVSAVTAACMMLRKEVFEEVGGFETEGLPVAFNDVDLCMRIAEHGYENVLVASRSAYHAESKSRGFEDTAEKIARFGREIEFMKARWGTKLVNDRFYSPNLALMHAPYQRIDVDRVIDQEFDLPLGALVR